MAERVWDRFLTEQDKAHLAASPPKGRYGFGRRPAILSVDNYRKAVGDRPEPLLDAITIWPSSTGQAGWEALGRIEELFKVARDVEIPVIHVTALGQEESAVPAGVHVWEAATPPGTAHPRNRTGTGGGSTSSSRPLRSRARWSCARRRRAPSSARRSSPT